MRLTITSGKCPSVKKAPQSPSFATQELVTYTDSPDIVMMVLPGFPSSSENSYPGIVIASDHHYIGAVSYGWTKTNCVLYDGPPIEVTFNQQ